MIHYSCYSNIGKLSIVVALLIVFNFAAHGQETDIKESLLRELAENACKCVDSISTYNRSRAEVDKDINKCIADRTSAYQLGAQLGSLEELTKGTGKKRSKKSTTITVNVNEESTEYKQYYYELERYMMENCSALRQKVASNDKQSEHSISDNAEALELYDKGLEKLNDQDWSAAIQYFEKAVVLDSGFAFAWDNIGICYRKLGKYDEAIAAYSKSLEADPSGIVPLQNIAVVYQYKKEYQLAIDAYNKLSAIDSSNPEVYYGLGHVYATNLNDMENGLRNMCKAYNLYIEQKSPYRTDAENIISVIYAEMKKAGKESEFRKILKENNITMD